MYLRYVAEQMGKLWKIQRREIRTGKRYQNYSFEIVDELYGYNQVLYSGYLSILETEDLVQMDISIYFTGKIIYDTKE